MIKLVSRYHSSNIMGCSSSRVPGKLKMYYMPPSAPCRSVMLTAYALGIKLDLKLLDLMAGEHLKPDFLKINPQHCIPTLDDEGFILWESRAICAYLVNMYAKDDSLYPKDPRKRAIVDARLDFDQGSLAQSFNNIASELFRGSPPSDESKKKLEDAIELLETYLKNSAWAAGDHITIADFCLVATITSIEATVNDLKQYHKVNAWLKRAKTEMHGFKEANQDGVDLLKELYKSFMDKSLKKEVEEDDAIKPLEKLEEVVKAAATSDSD